MAKFPMIIVNETLPLVLTLSPNPNSISIDRSKVFSKTQTVGGWVFEHWGEQPRILKVKGRTQTILGSNGNNVLTTPGKNTIVGVEAALMALQQIYNLDKRPAAGLLSMVKNAATKLGVLNGSASPSTLPISTTFIYYKLDLYQGFFTNFSYEQRAEDMPRHYEYQFEFLITGSAQNTLADSVFGTSLAPLVSLATGGPGQALLAGAIVGAGLVSGGSDLNILS